MQKKCSINIQWMFDWQNLWNQQFWIKVKHWEVNLRTFCTTISDTMSRACTSRVMRAHRLARASLGISCLTILANSFRSYVWNIYICLNQFYIIKNNIQVFLFIFFITLLLTCLDSQSSQIHSDPSTKYIFVQIT